MLPSRRRNLSIACLKSPQCLAAPVEHDRYAQSDDDESNQGRRFIPSSLPQGANDCSKATFLVGPVPGIGPFCARYDDRRLGALSRQS
jgi:hypothetical protein